MTGAIILLLALLHGHAQQPSAEDTLAAGISQVREGDSLRALFTLNDAVSQLSARPDAPAALARAHAYRALVYARLDQPERARAAVLLALKADPSIVIASPEFTPAAVALFDAARQPTDTNPEATARAAEQAGRFQEAFLAYLTAYEALPEPAPAADDQRLREKIIKVVQKLDTKPAIPSDAREHLKKAEDLLSADALLGKTSGGASSEAAAAELRKAVRSAPWWPDASFKLATVLQGLQRVDEALVNLSLYRLADPQGYSAAVEAANPKPAPNLSSSNSVAAGPAAAVVKPALIHIYRSPAFVGSAARPKVLCDEQHVADLMNDRFIVLKAASGTHSVQFAKDKVSLDVEAGQEYYLRAAFGVRAGIRPATRDEAIAEIREKSLKANDPRRTYGTECKAVAAVRKSSYE